MKHQEFNRTQTLARRDGRVQIVNLHPTFQASKDKPVLGNPYKHMDELASDYAGNGVTMYKLAAVSRLVVTGSQRLSDDFIKAVQSN